MGSLGDDVHKELEKYRKIKYAMKNRSPADHEPVEEWIMKMMNDNVSFSSTWSICRVPQKLRSVKNEAYDPQLVSIGPIHYEDKRLRSMEDHKQHYLISLFQRRQPHDVAMSLDECCFTILKRDKEVRACYADSIEPVKFKLAKILLQDAGFMLELFLRSLDTDDSRVQHDSVFTTSWMKGALQRDLALFENQIPFFVLELLYQFIFSGGGAGVPSLNDLARINDETYSRKCTFKGKHLLHLLYNCYLPSSPETRKTGTLEFIHNATSLKSAGVSFKKSGSDHLLDLKFNKGVFYIPTLRVHGATDSLFRNFIAFEQCLPDTPHYITSYCMLLDRLVDTAEDVEILVDKHIIKNDLGDGSEVSSVFNDICREVDLKDFYFPELCKQVNEYSEDTWHHNLAQLRLNYFNTPWSIIKFGAAFILLLLTFLQTLYSVLSYYQSPHRPTAIIAVFSSLGGMLFIALLAIVVCLLKKKKNKKNKKKRLLEREVVVHVDQHLKGKEAINQHGSKVCALEIVNATSSSSNDPPHHRRPTV